MAGHITTLPTDWIDLRCDTGPDHVFAIGDIHGQDAVLSACYATVARCIQPGRKRHLVHLGDLIDRGPGSLAALELADLAQGLAEVDVSTVLPGNHELMLFHALAGDANDTSFWMKNGGIALVREILSRDPDAEALGMSSVPAMQDMVRAALPESFLALSDLGQTHVVSGDLLLVHAGLHPLMDRETFLAQGNPRDRNGDIHWAWIREPFLNWDAGWDAERRQIVVHGHTVCIKDWIRDDMTILRNALRLDRRRICLDAGAAMGRRQALVAEFLDGAVRLHAVQVDLPLE